MLVEVEFVQVANHSSVSSLVSRDAQLTQAVEVVGVMERHGHRQDQQGTRGSRLTGDRQRLGPHCSASAFSLGHTMAQ